MATPLMDVFGDASGGRGIDGALSGGGAFVGGHARTWGVDDECAVVTGFGEEGIEVRGHLFFAGHGVGAGVGVPHVAHDDRCGGGVPLFFGGLFCEPRAGLEREVPRLTGEGGERDEDEREEGSWGDHVRNVLHRMCHPEWGAAWSLALGACGGDGGSLHLDA